MQLNKTLEQPSFIVNTVFFFSLATGLNLNNEARLYKADYTYSLYKI